MTKPKRLPWRCRTPQQAKDKAAIYNSREWRELRTLKLRTTPLCERCRELGIKAGVPGGYIRAASCVHHIIPIESARTPDEMRRLALHCGLDGLMSLCRQCHAEIHRQIGSNRRDTVQQHQEDRRNRRRLSLIERFTGQTAADDRPSTATDEPPAAKSATIREMLKIPPPF